MVLSQDVILSLKNMHCTLKMKSTEVYNDRVIFKKKKAVYAYNYLTILFNHTNNNNNKTNLSNIEPKALLSKISQVQRDKCHISVCRSYKS